MCNCNHASHLDLISGMYGGIASVVVGHPFDTIKVRQQTRNTGLWRAMKELHAESVRGYYKGATSPLIGQCAINAIAFGVQHKMMDYMTPNSLLAESGAGLVAGLTQCSVCTPMELVRIKMQTQGIGESYNSFKQHRMYKSPRDCAVRIYKKEGLPGLYKGNVTTMLREGPSYALYFASFEYLSRLFSRGEHDRDKRSAYVVCFAGGFSGQLTWFSTYPFDVIKTRLQDQSPGQTVYKNSLECARALWVEGGYRIFFRGLGVTLLRAFPVNAATFLVEEHSLYYLKQYFK